MENLREKIEDWVRENKYVTAMIVLTLCLILVKYIMMGCWVVCLEQPDEIYYDGIINEDSLQVGEEQQDAVNDFLSADPTPENTLEAQDELAAYYTETVESLQAKGETEAIERLYRAEFSEIPYDRKKSYEKLDISTG